jgi:hypothetical protein
LKVPCCDSVRSCTVTAVYVHDIMSGEIVQRIDAVRCYRLRYTPKVVVEFDPHRHIIYYLYVSSRGNPYISFYHIPPNLTETDAREFVLRAHGLV